MTVDWKATYKIGHAEIDQQHQYLFDLTNAMLATNEPERLRPLIMQLYKHTREHFELEESLMQSTNFQISSCIPATTTNCWPGSMPLVWKLANAESTSRPLSN